MTRHRKTIPACSKAEPIASQPDPVQRRPEEPQERQEWLLDEALSETFPASDPISPSIVP
jgi:hypothetical protein